MPCPQPGPLELPAPKQAVIVCAHPAVPWGGLCNRGGELALRGSLHPSCTQPWQRRGSPGSAPRHELPPLSTQLPGRYHV